MGFGCSCQLIWVSNEKDGTIVLLQQSMSKVFTFGEERERERERLSNKQKEEKLIFYDLARHGELL